MACGGGYSQRTRMEERASLRCERPRCFSGRSSDCCASFPPVLPRPHEMSCSSLSLSWYGWFAQAQIHWIMPIIWTGSFWFRCVILFTRLRIFIEIGKLLIPSGYTWSTHSTCSPRHCGWRRESIRHDFYFLVSDHPVAILRCFTPCLALHSRSSVNKCSKRSELAQKIMYVIFSSIPDTLSLESCSRVFKQLLAGLAIVLGIPFPIWIYFKGEVIRLNSKLKF